MKYSEHLDPIKVGDYEVRLLKNDEELLVFQKLRYEHLILEFFPERNDEERIDYNGGYDEITSQLCVFNTSGEKDELVGGYVLMRCGEGKISKTQGEFDLSRLLKKHPKEVLEASRAVVHPSHRNPIVLRLLWKGIEEYVEKFNLTYIIGTVSMRGLNPAQYVKELSYLKQNYLMDSDIMVTSLQRHDLKLPELESGELDLIRRNLTPLLRGYLMNGSKVGEGVFVDKEFHGVDVFTILHKNDYFLRRLK